MANSFKKEAEKFFHKGLTLFLFKVNNPADTNETPAKGK
jgi:hypothetical protein